MFIAEQKRRNIGEEMVGKRAEGKKQSGRNRGRTEEKTENEIIHRRER